MIISGFTGIGKSTIANSSTKRIIDLESSDFNKADNTWYETYCKVAKRLSDQGYIVFVSCHSDVRNWFKYHNIPYVVIYPEKDLENEWTMKLQKRYDKTKLIKDYNALERTIKYFQKDINDIIINDNLRVSIDDINYQLEDYIDEAINMIER